MLTTIALSLASCGGLFCSQVSPTPVDQRAERILFEVLDDGSVAATVEIRYEGDPRQFSWVVPVTGTPDFVGVAPKDTLALLDAATTPSIIPPSTVCSNPPFEPFSGCADPLYAAVPGANDVSEGEGEGVNVTQYPSVGPFDDIVVVEGSDPTVLMAWLSDRGYQVTDQMRPFIEEYTVEGYKFLASKLQPDTDVKDMVPIRFHCPQPFPEIPLRLTAIAAEPEMGFTVFVAGAGRYTPSNYAEVKIADADIQTANGLTNYFALISKRIDEAGGLGYVVEGAMGSDTVRQRVDGVFIDGSEDENAARIHLDDILAHRTFVTRFYGRMSPEEMVEDPQFIPRPDGSNAEFDGTYDLSSRTIDVCPADGQAQPVVGVPTCGTTYCGDGDACAASDVGDGCVCRGTHLARAINGPSGAFQVACASPDIDVHGAINANPCASTTCGNGQCIPVNDRATCKCDDGNVAVVDGNQVRCVEQRSEVFESDQLLWPTPESDVVNVGGGGGCAGTRSSHGALSVAMLFGAVAAMRRLLRRR